MDKLIKVIEPQSHEILFSCELADMEKAYRYAAQMEEMGIEAIIKAPSLPETLARELGSKDEDIQQLQEELESEIEDHDLEQQFSSCSFCPPKEK